MAVRIEEFVAYLGWQVDDDELEAFNDSLNDTIGFFAKVSAAIVGATAALTAFTVATNKETAQQANLAESVGITTETLEALSSVARGLGLEADNVIDLMEEMNNKFGEMKGLGELTSLQEGVKLLGLEYKNLKDLEPEQQFLKILDAAKNLEDQQRAVSGVDMIFGGEANKILGAIRQIDGSLEEFIEKRKQLNFLTDDAIEQAKEFNLLWEGFTTVMKTVKAAFAAYLGEALQPLLSEFLDWVRANRELIKLKVAEWAEKVGKFLEIVFRALKWGVFVLDRVVDAFGGFENVLAAITGALIGIGIAKTVDLIRKAIPIVKAATVAFRALNWAMIGKWAAIAAAIALVGLAINSLIRWSKGQDSLLGDMIEENKADIAEFFGMTEEEFDEFLKNFKEGLSDFVDGVDWLFNDVWKTISDFFERFAAVSWDEIFEVWKWMFSEFVTWLEELWQGFVDWITTTVPNAISNAFQKALNSARQWASQLPLIGDLIDAPQQVGALGAGFTGGAGQQVSVAAQRAVAQNQSISNSVKNIKGGAQSTGPITMNITQREGESGEALGRRITSSIREEFASAVRDNDTGVDY
jgi:hypothetical protein